MSVLSVLVSCYDYFFQTQSCCTADCISNSKGSRSLHAVDSSWWCPWFSECTKINSRTNQTSRNGNKINQLNSVLTSFKWNETKSMYTHVACQDFKWKHIDNVTFSEIFYFIPTWEWMQYCRDLNDAHEQFRMVSFFLLFSQELPQEMKCRMYIHTVMPCPFSRWDKWWWIKLNNHFCPSVQTIVIG